MSDPQKYHPDDPITRAIVATRQLPIPEGPAVVTVSNTLAALHSAANQPTLVLVLRRLTQISWKSKAAALIVVAASILMAYLVLFAPAGGSVVLAQVVEKLAAAKMLSFDLSVESAADKSPIATGRMIFAEPNKIRSEMHMPKQVFGGGDGTGVFDFDSGESLVLIPEGKLAISNAFKISQQSFLKKNMIERMQSLCKESMHSLGIKRIDGIEAEGFQIDRPGLEVRFWANPKTCDPVRLEIKNFPMPPPFGQSNFVAGNFKLDQAPDPALFSFDPPEGYASIRSPFTVDLTPTPEANVAALLRLYAKQNDGNFPPQLSDVGNAVNKELEKHAKAGKPSASDATEMMMFQGNIAQLKIYLQGYKQGSDYQYYPGVRLGEKDRIVFWRRGVKTGQYTALFGDLRIEKIDKEKLPPEESSKK